MRIEYFGHSCFRLTSNSGVSLLTDPYTRVGYELPEGIKADVVIVSHGHFDHNYTQGVEFSVCIDSVGEYAYKDVKIKGNPSYHDEVKGAKRGENVVFVFEIDGLRVAHLGDLGEPYEEKWRKTLADIDVLLLPVGGTYTIDAYEAKVYAESLAVKTIVPMHHRADGNLDIAPVEVFLSQYREEDVTRRESEYSFNGNFPKILLLERGKIDE